MNNGNAATDKISDMTGNIVERNKYDALSTNSRADYLPFFRVRSSFKLYNLGISFCLKEKKISY